MPTRPTTLWALFVNNEFKRRFATLEEARQAAERYIQDRLPVKIENVVPAPSEIWHYNYEEGAWVKLNEH